MSDPTEKILTQRSVMAMRGGEEAINHYSKMMTEKEYAEDRAKEFEEAFSELKTENPRLREALEWYANRDHYYNTGYTVMDDKGQRARDALAGTKQGDQDVIAVAENRPLYVFGESTPQPDHEKHCNWTWDEHHDFWDTDCGHGYYMGDGTTPKDDVIRYCWFCGKPVRCEDAAQKVGTNA